MKKLLNYEWIHLLKHFTLINASIIELTITKKEKKTSNYKNLSWNVQSIALVAEKGLFFIRDH